MSARASSLFRRSRLVIGVVTLLVPIISMPRLEAYAREANETDALRAVRLLGDELFESERSSSVGAQSDAAPRLDELMARETIAHRLGDARPRADGIWSYHGYLFRLIERAQAEDGRPSAAILAWPRECGSSGRAVFAACSERGLLQHRNAAGRFDGATGASSGTAEPPSLTPESGFEPLRVSPASDPRADWLASR